MAYLKKITVQLENGTAEKIAVGSLEKRILEEVKENQIQLWKIAEKYAISQHYFITVYQTALKMTAKKLIKTEKSGKRRGLTVELTEKGKKVLEMLEESEQKQNANKKDVKICAPYELC